MHYYNLFVDKTNKFYTYSSDNELKKGEWCTVNFINSLRMALVVSEIKEEEITIDLNKIKKIIGKAPVLSIPENIMKLMEWMTKYYLSRYDRVLSSVYPGILKLKYNKVAVYIDDLKSPPKKQLTIYEGEKTFEDKFNEYMKKKQSISYNTLKKHFDTELIKKAVKEKAIFIEKKLVLPKIKNNVEYIDDKIEESIIILNKEQKKVFDEIKYSDNKLFLLKGTTGSGKTYVYMKLIYDALLEDRGSIFLVPEIALTAQMIDNFQKQFKDKVAILHSKLTIEERKKEWTYLREGKKKIVIGARSAIFAPIQNLKYIIIDEEHESTYKQEKSPRYHTKNVAIKRSMIEGNDVKIIFGSATPSFETYYQTKIGQIKLLELTKRYNDATFPDFEVINLNETTDNFTEQLLLKIENRLSKREQVMLMLNKKAFSNMIKCKDCGHIPECPHCSISLNYYKSDNVLRCNYCGYEERYTKICNHCNSKKIYPIGSGTEKIENELREIFPSAQIVRVDSETIKDKDYYENVYNDFKNGKYDIMIGTQIISKGFHFPNVTLVGIVNADIILHFPDFRAGEKTFQLLSQSAGRAGRGNKKGEVVIQTFDDTNEVILKTIDNDYEGYYNIEIDRRKMFNYPPFGKLIVVIISSENEKIAEESADLFYNNVMYNINKLNLTKPANLFEEIVSKPFKAPMYKIKKKYRFQIFIKTKISEQNKVKSILKKASSLIIARQEKSVNIAIDVDPINIM